MCMFGTKTISVLHDFIIIMKCKLLFLITHFLK